jgi:molybdopterin-binding protein
LRADGVPYILPADTSEAPAIAYMYPFQPHGCRAATTEKLMKISARNQIKGKILEVKKGATTAHVRLEIGPNQVITSSITNEAVDELGLKAGMTAFAVIKASEVMIAVE